MHIPQDLITLVYQTNLFRNILKQRFEEMNIIRNQLRRSGIAPIAAKFSEEVEDMLERTRDNPNAIIYGTFYSYPVM